MMTAMRCIMLAALGLVLNGCGQEEAKAPELPPRAIKHMTIEAIAANATRKLAGIVVAGTRANVAFEVGGSVTVVAKKVGESVEKGEVIAKLDPKDIKLQVQEGEFALKQAEATLKDTREKLAQQKHLRKNGYTTKTALDTARANFANAEGQVGIARSQLDLRRQDLEKTVLMAPFDGTVSERKVEVFEEVKAGEAIFVLQTQGENEVEVSVPETLIGFVKVGDEVDVRISPLNGATVKGLVTEVSPQAGSANAFPVTVRLNKSPPGLRPGMSAEITISFKGEATGKGFSVPVAALKPSIEKQTGTVFVYDAEAGVVRQKSVKVVGLAGNSPQIVGDIKPGDIIATAGVGQMFDGMKVRLLDASKPF